MKLSDKAYTHGRYLECPICSILFEPQGIEAHMAWHRKKAACIEQMIAEERPMPRLEGSPHGKLVKALSAIKQAYEQVGCTFMECDIRAFGEAGVEPLHTEEGRLRVEMNGCRHQIKIRIHRSPSDVYFIDSCELI